MKKVIVEMWYRLRCLFYRKKYVYVVTARNKDCDDDYFNYGVFSTEKLALELVDELERCCGYLDSIEIEEIELDAFGIDLEEE